MRFGPLTLGITVILGMAGGATGCHSSTPAADSSAFSSLEQADKYQWLASANRPITLNEKQTASREDRVSLPSMSSVARNGSSVMR